MADRQRTRRAPALGARILVAAGATAATVALVGWMGREATADDVAPDPAAAIPPIIRRVVVVEPQPAPEPYIVLEAGPAGRTVTVVTQPARIVHTTTAAAPPAPGQVAAVPVTTSSGS